MQVGTCGWQVDTCEPVGGLATYLLTCSLTHSYSFDRLLTD